MMNVGDHLSGELSEKMTSCISGAGAVEYEIYRRLLLCDDMVKDIVGEKRSGNNGLFPFDKIPFGSRIVLYGAGRVGHEFLRQLEEMRDYYRIVLWLDQRAAEKEACVEEPERIRDAEYDYAVIAIEDPKAAGEARKRLLELGVPAGKIQNGVCGCEDKHYEKGRPYLIPVIESQVIRLQRLMEEVYGDSGCVKKQCAICGAEFPLFLHGLTTEFQVCPNCGSLVRHRTLWLYLKQTRSGLLFSKEKVKLLHFAPERWFYEKFKEAENIDYYPVDLSKDFYMPVRDVVDITDIKYEDQEFDFIMCSHVLEHIPEDRKAMEELFRVLKPGGTAYLLFPWDESREITFENLEFQTPELREKYFGQFDHVRICGRDVVDRLKRAGFTVEVQYPNRRYTFWERRMYGLYENEAIFCCVKQQP